MVAFLKRVKKKNESRWEMKLSYQRFDPPGPSKLVNIFFIHSVRTSGETKTNNNARMITMGPGWSLNYQAYLLDYYQQKTSKKT